MTSSGLYSLKRFKYPRALVHMVLFFGGLNYGRHVSGGLGLGIGDMPLLNDEAGAVLADLRAARRHVYGVPAALKQGKTESANSGGG